MQPGMDGSQGLLIRADGTFRSLTKSEMETLGSAVNLDAVGDLLSELIGCEWFSIIATPSQHWIMWGDGESKLKPDDQIEINHVASMIYQSPSHPMDWVCGNVVLLPRGLVK